MKDFRKASVKKLPTAGEADTFCPAFEGGQNKAVGFQGKTLAYLRLHF
jgi:hypothetical protein